MSIIRVRHDKNNPYTLINTSIAEDNRISWKAKGIWLYAFSRKDDWSFYMNDLIKRSTDGQDSIRAGVKELEACGYLYRQMKRCEATGQARGHEWTFFETPKSEEEIKEMFTEVGVSRPSVNPDVGKTPPLTNTDSSKASKKQQTGPSAVVVFSCLSKVEIPQQDKEWLSRTYTEARVELAVAYMDDPSTIIKTTRSQTLKWHCGELIPPVAQKTAAAATEENLKFLKSLKPHNGKTFSRYKIDILSRSIEFNLDGCSEANKVFSVESKTFISDVDAFYKKITGK